MTGGELVFVGTLLSAVIILLLLYQVERSKRVRSEERVETISIGVQSAHKTARIMHEIAQEREAELAELSSEHADVLERLRDKSKALHDAQGSSERIAGLFNERMREERDKKEDDDG